MYLYLVRHGAADHNIIDNERRLSERGQWQVEKLADYMAERCPQPPVIYHSGLLRAQQTAEGIAHRLQAPTPQTLIGLQPQDDTAAMLLNISQWQNDTMLVGHLPYLQILLVDLIGVAGLELEFAPATAVCLSLLDQRWQIQWRYSH